MSDTIYEKDGLYVTRYWGGERGDCLQITILAPDNYTTMTLVELKKMVKAVYKNVRDTEDAWWHKLNKS